MQSSSELAARAIDAVGNCISGACRDMAQAHARRYSCQLVALCPQAQQAIHDLLEEAIPAYLYIVSLPDISEQAIKR